MAQTREAASGRLAQDHEAIAGTIQLYVDGFASGDVAKLEEAFHEHAWMFGRVGDVRQDIQIQELFAMVGAMPPMDSEGTYEARITSIEQVGDVATVRLDEDGCWGTTSFADFFHLARIDGRWKIVNKTFAHLGGPIPGM